MDERLVTHMHLFYDEVLSPVGALGLAWDKASLRALSFENPGRNLLDLLRRSVGDRHGTCAFERSESPYREPLNRYFSGELTALDALQAECTGTPFQKLVWQALRRIPCGMTWSYSQLAEAIGRPRAARAVGLANSQNPVAIVVPCHRVIGANGSLVGYGGGLARKLWLLRHEGASVEQLKAPEVTISNEHQGHLF